MDEEKYIIDVEVKGADDAEDQLKAINALTDQLNKNTNELAETNKKLEAQGKNNTQVYQDNAKQIDANQKAVSKNNAEVKSINNSLKENSSTLTKSKVSMQDFTGALDKAVPGLGGFVSTIMSATKASLAFIATPIGIVLAAIVAGLALLSTYFTRTEEGGDKLTRVWAQLTAVAEMLLNHIAKLGGALMSIIQGDFAEGFNKIKDAIVETDGALQHAWETAGQLADLLDALEDRELAYKVAVSTTTNEIKKLIIESKNRLLTEQQKIDKLQQAFDMEVKQNQVLKGIEADRLHAAVEQFNMDAMTAEGKRKANETDLEYAKRLITIDKETVANRQLVADALIKYNETEGESLNLQEKLSNAIDAQTERQRVKFEAAGDAKLKQIEIDKAADLYYQQKAIADQLKVQTDYITWEQQQEAKAKTEIDLAAQVANEMEAINDEEQKQADANFAKDQERDKKKIALTKATEQAKLSLYQQGLSAVGSLFDQASEEFKQFQIVQTLISTYAAAQRAFESQLIPGDPTSIVRAVAAAIFASVQGLARVAQIEKFEDGGLAYTVGGKRHSQGGTKFYGEDGTRFEAEQGEGIFVLKRDAHASLISNLSGLNQKYNGRSWFSGGSEKYALGGNVIPITQSGQMQMQQGQMLDLIVSVVSSLPRPQVSVVDINNGQAAASQVEVASNL